MSTGPLKTRMGWALCALAGLGFATFGSTACAVDASEPQTQEFEQEERTVVTGQALDPGSMDSFNDGGGTSEDGPEGQNEEQQTTSGFSTDEEEEPDPDPWQFPIVPGNPDDGDGDGDTGDGHGMEDPP